mgnify:CR=1 FL=1
MIIENLLKKQQMTKYRLAVQAGIPHATLSDICSGKTKIEKCSAETVYKLAKALGVSMELLTEDGIRQTERERAYEYKNWLITTAPDISGRLSASSRIFAA